MTISSTQQPAQIKRAATMEEVREAMNLLQRFVSHEQLAAIAAAMQTEEQQWFFDKAVELAKIIEDMPVTYQTDGQGEDAIAFLHYFLAGCDWFITELDVLEEQCQAFGQARICERELGYINLNELMANNVELDLYWSPTALKDIA